MAYYYMDTDAGLDTNTGLEWIGLAGYTLATALASATETSVVVNEAIDVAVPATGNIRITADNGVVVTVAYSAWATSTFTITSTDFTVNLAAISSLVGAEGVVGGVKTLEGLLALMAAGDTGFVQGLADDSRIVSKTFISAGISENPCKVIGVVNGTTNVGVGIVAADLAVTLPVVSCVGAGLDMGLQGVVSYSNIKFICPDQFTVSSSVSKVTFIDAYVAFGGRARNTNQSVTELNNTIIEQTSTSAQFDINSGAKFTMIGGSLVALGSIIRNTSYGDYEFIGADLSSLGTAPLAANTTNAMNMIVKNCKVSNTFAILAGSLGHPGANATAIGCSDTVSQVAASSIQNYSHKSHYGTVDLEQTIVRTGGANDGATGAFSYAMKPYIDTTLEGTSANLISPWMNVWVSGGATTLTMYICNDQAELADNDFHEDEVWAEFYTPDAGDTAQHDQTFVPASTATILFGNEVSLPDDTGSIWGTGGNNHQKLSITVTTGFEGFAYARLHFAKRYAGTATILYLDPKIVVT